MPKGASTGYTAGAFVRILLGHLVVISLATLLWLTIRGGTHESRVPPQRTAVFDASHPVFPGLEKIRRDAANVGHTAKKIRPPETAVGL